ncbi:hypothetical protein [Actinoplanes sp. L3-i22]|uniref:hypothetical protein n=1 Tax=Actinoplanes sp. L3-i22 TaxID=2836373 RepID=UPI001C77CCE7|nr:hypothetical protein [Actinoplanes sp. L3-i22]BCY05496.1 hypothetical protein L3i22_005840 [Actinoplanes sp. L3-i22]
MTDQLEQLFADLRNDTMPRILPPGTEAARNTVRRRRRRTAAITTAGLVVVVAAGIGLGGQPMTRHTATAPALPPAAREALARSAAHLIGLDQDDPPIGGTAIEAGRQTRSLVAGDYEVRATCVGDAGYVAMVVAGTPFTLFCNGAPPILTVPVTVAASDQPIDVIFTPDPEAEGRSGVAYSLALTEAARERMQVAAHDAVGSGSVSVLSGFLTKGSTGTDDQSMTAGKYRITVACVGTGAVRVDVGRGRPDDPGVPVPVATFTQKCADVPAVGHLDVTMPKGTKVTIIDVSPTAAAIGQAAAAVRVDRR